MTTRYRWLFRTIAGVSACIGVLGVGAVAEWAIRLREAHRATVPGTMPLAYYRHKRLGVALVRNSDNFGWVHVDSLGFRGPDIAKAKRPGVLRIVTTGGSTTFDSEVVGDSNTWPARLQFWLSQLAPEDAVEVINAGVPGYGVAEDTYRLQHDIASLAPDLIIELQGHNDLFATLVAAAASGGPGDTPDEVEPITPWSYWLSRHSLFYTKIKERFGIMRFHSSGAKAIAGGDSTAIAERTRDGIARFGRDLAGFTTVAKMLGANVVVVEPINVSGWQAHVDSSEAVKAEWRAAMPFASAHRVLAGYAAIDSTIEEVAKRLDVHVVPASTFPLVGRQYYSEGDPIHFNNAGADSMARLLAGWLVKSGPLSHGVSGHAERGIQSRMASSAGEPKH